MTRLHNNASRSRANDEDAASYKQHLDEQLDEALKETFPASDPIAVTPRRRRPLPKDIAESGQRISGGRDRATAR